MHEPLDDDLPTLGALAALAFVIACVGHEAVGHGGACLASGGRIVRLTSVFFSCAPGIDVVDAAGPCMNLLLAALAWAALRTIQGPPALSRLLGLVFAFNGFWGAGYFVFSGITGTGDWAFLIHESPLPTSATCALMIVAGVMLYGVVMRTAAPWLPHGRPIVVAYLCAGIVACVSTLFYEGSTLAALPDAVQESLLASIGLLVRARWSRIDDASIAVPRDRRIQVAAFVVVVAFWITLGHGVPA